MTNLPFIRNWKTAAGALAAGLLLALGAAPGAALAAPEPPAPRILKLYHTADPRQDSVFALDDYITLEVAGLTRAIRQEEARLRQLQMDPAKAHAQAMRLVLYLGDAPLIGLPPESLHTVPPAPARLAAPADSGRAAPAGADTITKVIYHLARRQSTNLYWNVVYRSPWEFAHPSQIGLGYDDRVLTNMYPQGTVRLKLVRPVALGVALGVVALLAAGIVLLARKSWLLRSAVPAELLPPGTEPMFSLSKSQLAWWTFLVIGSYLLIYCITGEMTNISTTTLELLGISAGTAGLGSLIGGPPSGATLPPAPSRGWWLDMLTDDQGVSIHRLQQVAFTLLLGYLFVRTVYKTVAMPEWDDNEVLLLGISSATYLGLKSQETRGTADATALPNTTTTTNFGSSADTSPVSTQPTATAGGTTAQPVPATGTADAATGQAAPTTDPGMAPRADDGTGADAVPAEESAAVPA